MLWDNLRLIQIVTKFCRSVNMRCNRSSNYRISDKISFIDNPYLFLATRFVYNYTHHQAIFVTICFLRRQFYQTLLKLSGAFNLELLY